MIQIYTIVVSDFGQNCRLILDEESRELLIVDPGAEAEKILTQIRHLHSQFALEKIQIILTHMHIDHVGAVSRLIALIPDELDLAPELLFHKDADPFRESIQLQANFYGLNIQEYQNVPSAQKFIAEGDMLSLGENSIQVLDTPGHAQGHISLFFKVERFSEGSQKNVPFLIAGDTLFQGSIGRTDLPGGNHQQLIDSIKNKILVLPLDTIVLSGHGPNTTVGIEKETNYFLR